jgi:putative flippase GtrA
MSEPVDNLLSLKSILSLAKSRVFRFALVGVFNTLLNFTILNLAFYQFKLGKVASNFLATGVALAISFFLNRNFVFVHKGHWVKQLVRFAVVTIIGTILINNLVYIFFVGRLLSIDTYLSSHIHLFGVSLSPIFVQINGAAFVATLCTMVWNYNGYKKFVFIQPVLAND